MTCPILSQKIYVGNKPWVELSDSTISTPLIQLGFRPPQRPSDDFRWRIPGGIPKLRPVRLEDCRRASLIDPIGEQPGRQFSFLRRWDGCDC